MPRPLLSFAAVGALAGLAAACTNFDRADQVNDLRVLAAVTDPAEVFYDASVTSGAPFPPTEIALSVFAFDPRGGEVTTTVELCPPDDDTHCSLVGKQEGEADADDPAGRITNADFIVTLDDPLFRSFVPGLSFSSALPTLQIVVENPGADDVKQELAFKRLPITLDLATLPPPLAAPIEQIYGVPLCEAPSPMAPPQPPPEPGVALCVRPLPANSSPVLVGFDIGSGDPADALVVGEIAPFPSRAVVTAASGAELRIDPVLTEGSVELYQVQTIDLVSSNVGLDNRTEDVAVAWTSTDGDVSRATTVLSDEVGLGIIWRLADGKSAGERDAVVVVVFDQRGGIAVGQIDVEYE